MSVKRYHNTEDGMEDDNGDGPGWGFGEPREYVKATDHEAAVAALEARLGELRAALERINAIENHYGGGDWDEIEEARAIAGASLTAGKGEA